MVDEAARGGHEHVVARSQVADILLNRGAAIDAPDPHVGVLRVVGGRLGHLDCQLTRGAEDQRAKAVAAAEAVKGRKNEGRGLAGAGLRPSQHVASFECVGDGHLLNGSGRVVAQLGYCSDEFRSEVEFLEGHACVPLVKRPGLSLPGPLRTAGETTKAPSWRLRFPPETSPASGSSMASRMAYPAAPPMFTQAADFRSPSP